MAVPTKNQLNRVILEVAAETAQALSRGDVVELVSARLSLTEEDLAEQSSSGVFRVADRTDWAMFDLRRAGYLYRPARGRFVITAAGRAILSAHQGEIADADLRPVIAMQQQSGSAPRPDISTNAELTSDDTPSEQMQYSFQRLQDD